MQDNATASLGVAYGPLILHMLLPSMQGTVAMAFTGNISFKLLCPRQQLRFKHLPLTMISQMLDQRRISLSHVGNNDIAITYM
jgi:hypothetical protein